MNLNIKISKIHLIKPSFISTQNLEDRYEVLILFAQLQKGGFISGGACGPIDKKNEIFERAYAELFRHSLAFDRHQSQKLEPTNDYDRRLIYFGSGQGNDLVMERLTDSIDATKKPVQVPNTWVRRFIAHPYATSFKVHQCLFENQQPFIDSRMDILCL
ncbi:MAG: hypothetical protein ACOYOK_07290 [Pseudobdellovibrionaceae bacterium]